jgi:outer membrane protein, multidrug efflux system
MRARLLPLTALLLSACTEVGPDYHQPDIAAPSSFAEENGPLSVADSGAADLTRWWSALHDTELDSLISRGLAANLDLQAAASRVREAREQEVIANAALQPNISATADTAQIHSGKNFLSLLSGSNGSSGSGAAPSGGGTSTSLYSLGFDATWEIDVFGGARRGIEAAKAGTEAARWQMRDGEVTLSAEIATDYIALRAAQARLAILQGELKSQNATLNLIAARAKGGFVTQLDVNQQSALSATTEAQIPTLEADARTMEHAIAVLLAVEPDALTGELDKMAPMPEIPTSLPVGLPSDLLRRRPDIREAERKLAQATANEGVAVSKLYPTFNLIGALNIASNSLGSLFNTTSLNEIGAGLINWPLFHGGDAHANIRAKEEEEKQDYLAYQKAVLGAVQDSEDALVRYAAEQRRYLALGRALSRDQSSTAIATQQYQAGLTNYVNVLTAESNELQVNDQLAQSKQALATDLASLYKALGGGWHEDDDPGVSPQDPYDPLKFLR